MLVSPDKAALEVLEVIPLVMRVIRLEMREHRRGDLSVPQFRALAYLSSHEGASLSDLALHIGLALPSMSKLVDGLWERKLVSRRVPSRDRRRLNLQLTSQGRATFRSAYASARAQLAARLAVLPDEDRSRVVEGLRALRPLFS